MTAARTAVVVGAGLAGLATAVAAADRGVAVTVLEKGDLAGGAASFSGGQVWVAANHLEAAQGIPDDLDAAEQYVRAVGASHPELIDDAALARWLTEAPRAARYFEDAGAVTWEIIPDYPDYHQDAPGSRATGRYLTAAYDARRLGAWRDRLRVSPHFPVGTGYAEILGAGLRASAFGAPPEADPLRREDRYTFGTGVVAGFLVAALERGVEILLEHTATELCVDDGRVTGVVAETPDGARRILDGPVVLATSGYDWDDELAHDFLGLTPADRGSVAPRTLTGDGIRLARQAGGAVVEFPAARVPVQVGYPVDGYPGFQVAREHSLPHTFVVDRTGRRFCDDAVYWEIAESVLEPGSEHLPCFMIWDSRHHRRYGLGPTPPGGVYPPEVVSSASSLRDLGTALGIDGVALEATAARFSADVASGSDPEFGRGTNTTWQRFQGDPSNPGHPNLGPVDEPPFFGMRLTMVSTGIGLTGIAVDPDGQVLTSTGGPVEGLHAAGAAAAFTSSGTAYNSGFSLSRAITLGLLVAERL
ncbi:FAD-dependent oxidoreductase [Pseudonocardia sp.]|uniref:FAD-dependent oxidoreductase n=1 Tax=Pseudonocardia sp. TaxID=60912 RepID=UPI003D0C0781